MAEFVNFVVCLSQGKYYLVILGYEKGYQTMKEAFPVENVEEILMVSHEVGRSILQSVGQLIKEMTRHGIRNLVPAEDVFEAIFSAGKVKIRLTLEPSSVH